MGCGSPKHNPRESGLELINHFSDTASSASSTCSDLSIPSCASSSLYSGFTTSSKMGSDTESASSTPRTTPSKNIPRPGKHAQGNCTSKVLSISNSVVSLQQSAPAFELQEDPEFWNDHNVQVHIRSSDCRMYSNLVANSTSLFYFVHLEFLFQRSGSSSVGFYAELVI